MVVKKFPIEAMCWIVGLLVLAFISPTNNHVSICPLNNLGWDFCPGCGLGRAVTFLFHGELLQSFRTHPLGIFAVSILLYRIYQLTKTHFHTYGKSN
jgi:hypothetical protein